jgi:SRSO17 transposase
VAVTPEHFGEWQASFEAFHARFARFFRRSEPRAQARNYLRGLLSPVGRKNSWQMAEAVGEPDPARMQYLLYGAQWDADAVGQELQRFVVEQFGDPEGIAVVDESAFVKKGSQSVGVKRQWCSTLGKKENCQVAVFLSYVSPHGHTFLDRRLYLPEEWCTDTPRRRAAQVPEAVEFQTKPQLARAMLERAWKQGVPMRWVTGDEAYGNSPELRAAIHHHGVEQGLYYVLAVASNTRVWRERPTVEPPEAHTGGRPRKHPRLAPGSPPSEEVAAVVSSWPAERWQRFAVAPGEKGPRLYDWAAQKVVTCREQLPQEEVWLLARRSLSEPPELAYYFSDAPAGTPLRTLASVAAARWSVEQCFEEGKGEAGLDEYEVRYWQSWQRHITFSMMAHAWLASIRRMEREREPGSRAGGKRSGRRRPACPGGDHGSRGPTAPGSRAGVRCPNPSRRSWLGRTSDAGCANERAPATAGVGSQADPQPVSPLPSVHPNPGCSTRSLSRKKVEGASMNSVG